MIPIRDDNPTRSFPLFTIGIILINVVVFAFQFLNPPEAVEAIVYQFGAIPERITSDLHLLPAFPGSWLTILSSMFMHGGFMHLAGNMLYLWIFGNNIEDVLGKFGFLLFYLTGGVIAALTHIFMNPASDVPMVGASGAISAILGAYIVLFPRAHVIILLWVVFIVRFIPVPAFFVLGIWFVMQLTGVLGDDGAGAGIAWFAHIGGFVAGILMILASGARAKRNPRWM